MGMSIEYDIVWVQIPYGNSHRLALFIGRILWGLGDSDNSDFENNWMLQ